MKHTLERLDVIVAFSCNLACQGCISLSDRLRKGIVAFDDVKNGLQEWSTKLDPKIVAVFGGEPTLHPDLLKIMEVIRQQWPTVNIRLITNGYLLDNFPAECWEKFAPIELQISIHRQDHETIINQKIKKILLTKKNWQPQQHGGTDHRQMSWTCNGITIYKSIFKDFIAPYGNKINLIKYVSNPAQAHSICGSPNTPSLLGNKLYKCPAVANAYNIDNDFFEYDPAITINSNVSAFIDNIGKPADICSNCPDLTSATRIDHFNKGTVHVRQKNIS